MLKHYEKEQWQDNSTLEIMYSIYDPGSLVALIIL